MTGSPTRWAAEFLALTSPGRCANVPQWIRVAARQAGLQFSDAVRQELLEAPQAHAGSQSCESTTRSGRRTRRSFPYTSEGNSYGQAVVRFDFTRQHSTEPVARLIDQIGARLGGGEPIRIETVTPPRHRRRDCRRLLTTEMWAFGPVPL